MAQSPLSSALAEKRQTRILQSSTVISGMLAKKLPRPAYREEAIMKRSICAILLGGALVGAFALPATAFEAGLPLAKAPADQVGMSAKKLERIREALKGEIDQDKLPGIVVMVARKGQLVYADAVGFQDKNAGKAMALDSVFRIYSMTKPLVSVAAMMLVEDGKLQLTDPVAKFLPAF